MVQGYYTLPEAAKALGMPVDELKQMAQKGKIRSFQDRGTLRFRVQDIQELARTRGGTSDPELALGDASLSQAKSAGTPSSAGKKAPASPKTPAKQPGAPEVFDFDIDDIDDGVDPGADLPAPVSGSKGKPASKGKKAPTPPPAGSDSDVRLVADGSDVTFSIPKDSDIKLADSDVKISPDPLKPKTGVHPGTPSSGSKRPSQLALGSGAKAKSKPGGSAKPVSPRPTNTPPVDSGVRLVPMDSDSDVKLLGSSDDVPLGQGGDPSATDSNVRLDKAELPTADSSEGNLNLTEEINLDEEIRKQQAKDKDQPSTKLKPKSELKFPTTSPFELSDSDLDFPSGLTGPKTPKQKKASADDSSDFDLAAQATTDSGSSDFDLVPAEDGSILLEGADSNDFSLEASDENEQVLDQDHATELTSSTSGISLSNPVDAGISLEDNEEAGDFDLSLEVEDTPRPSKARPVEDSDSEFELSAEKTPKPKKAKAPADPSEFELTLDSDSDGPVLQEQGDSSEFELNLDGEPKAGDSEFELTLDDSGNLAAVEDEPAPQVKAKAKAKPKPKSKKPASADEQDIFDTDFEVPALDESDDATVADSELESSDFDLALDDSELAQEDESGSQVVALDEEDNQTVADDVDVEEESSDFQDLDEDVQVDEEVEVDVDADEETETAGAGKTVIQEKLIPAAPWGILPVIFMLPCVVVMFLVGILGYELVQTSAGLKGPGPLTMEIAKLINQPVK